MNEIRQFGPGFEHHFLLHRNKKTGQFRFAEEKISVIEEEPYDKAIAELNALLDQRSKNRDEELIETFASSKQSFDEIIEFLRGDPEKDWY